MVRDKNQPSNAVEWARRINRRWIVRGGLGDDAEAYLEHLAKEDPDRLMQSCRNSRRMIDLRDRSNDDPKPWFYAGLFSLATVDEAKRFLAGHSFTVEAIPGLATAVGASASIEDTSADTQAKLTRIREALTQVLDDRPR